MARFELGTFGIRISVQQWRSDFYLHNKNILIEYETTKTYFNCCYKFVVTGNILERLDSYKLVSFPHDTKAICLPESEANKITMYANSLARFISMVTSPAQVNEDWKDKRFLPCHILIDYRRRRNECGTRSEFRRKKLQRPHVPSDTHLSDRRELKETGVIFEGI